MTDWSCPECGRERRASIGPVWHDGEEQLRYRCRACGRRGHEPAETDADTGGSDDA